jgi:hypothetical protein
LSSVVGVISDAAGAGAVVLSCGGRTTVTPDGVNADGTVGAGSGLAGLSLSSSGVTGRDG